MEESKKEERLDSDPLSLEVFGGVFIAAVVAVFVVGLAMLADALSRLHGALFLVCFDAVVFRPFLEENGADGP